MIAGARHEEVCGLHEKKQECNQYFNKKSDMTSLLEMLTQQLGGDNMRKISSQIGANEDSTKGAISASLPLLINALSRNASSDEGANALSSALSRDHDGSILGNLSGFLGNPDQGSGEGILRHVLGSRKGMVENGLSRSSGLDAGSIGKLMSTLAPIVMGALGKVKRENGLDARSLAGYLGREREDMERSEPQAMGLMGNLLDADRDGDVDASDLVKHGLSLFSKFFKK